MQKLQKIKYLRTLLYLILLLLLVMVTVDILIVFKQRSLLIEESRSHLNQELSLIGTSIKESLLREDYAGVEQFLLSWGTENNGITSLKATAPNGFVLVNYERKPSGKNFLRASGHVLYNNNKLLDLEIVKDISYLDRKIAGIALNNIALSAIFAFVFGVMLWIVFRRTALMPMEQLIEEINLSKEALEDKVAERTQELVRINAELEAEIAERKLAEQKLRYRENYLRSMIEAEPECVKVLAEDGTILEMNPAGLAMLEADSPELVIGKKIIDFVLPPYKEALAALHRRVISGEKGTFVFEVQGLKGTRRWLETHAVPFKDELNRQAAVLAVTRDITENRKLEEQLRHAHKMEALGTLTGGIAHEFNNILTSVMGYGELLDEAIPPVSPLKDYVRMIRTSAERAAKLTKGLLAYSRRQVMHLAPVDLNVVLGQLQELLMTIIAENIELRVKTSEQVLTVLADRAQIEQVIMNLASNAVDAMPGGGVLSISLEPVFLDEEFIRHHGFGRPGAYALLSVTDTGVGMDKATLEKIFEPFFTTKEVGKGTGLGLAMVYGIIKRHNGFINAYSEPKKGTCIKVYLPVTETAMEVEKGAVATTVLGGTETILFAEDDPEVRAFVRLMLEKAGYTVIIATDGKDAIEKFSEGQQKIHLALLDIVMPRMNGLEVREEIKKINPKVKFVFISGYPAGSREDGEFREKIGGSALIAKPIVQSELLGAIRDALDSEGKEPTLF